MKRVLCPPSGDKNFEMSSRFLENFCIPGQTNYSRRKRKRKNGSKGGKKNNMLQTSKLRKERTKASRVVELVTESLRMTTAYRFLHFPVSACLFLLLAKRLFCTCGMFALK